MLDGRSDEFNEVFFTSARTSVDNLVGSENGGWAVAMTLLAHERGEEAATNPIMFRAELDRLFALAVEYGRAGDPVVRDRLAWCYTQVETMRFLGYRILTGYLRDGALGAEASISKLFWSEYHQRMSELAMAIMGPHGLVPEGRRPPRCVPHGRPGRPERHRVVGQHLPAERSRRHRLRGKLAGATQYPRRDPSSAFRRSPQRRIGPDRGGYDAMARSADPDGVGLAGDRSRQLVEDEVALRTLVAGEVLVADRVELGGEGVRGFRFAVDGGLDDGDDHFAPALVGDPDDDGIGDGFVPAQHVLDLLRVDLLATGVDARRSRDR